MTTHDFTKGDTNYGNDPRRAEQLRIASQMDLDAIKVDVFFGPPGNCGFRSGQWTATFEGATYKFPASVSHAAELEQQRQWLTLDAAKHIAGLKSGYIKAVGA
jgi:hypothetical protein